MERKINRKHYGSSLTRLLAGSAFLLLVACSGDNSLPYDNGQPDATSGELVPVSIEATVENGGMTRAVTTLTSGNIGIFRTAPVSTWCPAQYNVSYTNNGSGWQAASADNEIWVSGEDATLHAYYPYNSVTFDATVKTKATLVVKDYTVNNDFCYASAPTAVINNKNPKASFVMKHAYARITFKVVRDATYSASCKVSKLVLRPSSGTYFQTKTIDISEGEVSLADGTATAQYEWTSESCSWSIKDGISVGIPNESMDVLLPPQVFVADKMAVTLTIDGVNYSVDVPTGSGGSFAALKAGTRHRIELMIKGTILNVTGIKSYPWETSIVSGNNDAVMD